MTRLSALTAATTVTADDLLHVVDDPAGANIDKKITVADLLVAAFNSPTIVTPTIASFANANHNHSNSAGGGTIAHSVLTGLTAGDPHTQYALLAGRSGGQSLVGGSGSGESLTLESTSHATKGYIKPISPFYMKDPSAASPYLIQSTGQIFGATFDPFLIFGYNYNGATATRINTGDAASWFQMEGDYEHSRGGTVHDSEISYNVISTDGTKIRRPLGVAINRDNPDSWCAWTFAIHKAANGRVEIVNIADQTERFYDFRYDGFFTIQTTGGNTPNIALLNATSGKWIRTSGANFQILNFAYDTVIFSLDDVGGVGIKGDTTITEAKNIVLGTTTGTKIGTATSQKMAFWNKTPIIQPASANQAAVTTTAATQTTPYGYSTQAQADGIITLLNEIRNVLVNTGIMKGAA